MYVTPVTRGKGFNQRSDLKELKRIHTGDKSNVLKLVEKYLVRKSFQ